MVTNVCLKRILFLCSVSDHPICGNHIVEEGEECDVGQNDEDLCCFSAKQPVGVQCQLKAGKVCRSPPPPRHHIQKDLTHFALLCRVFVLLI